MKLVSEDLKPFMREVIEFISLLRASEKERYEMQKKFITDTVKTLKDMSETIKNSSDYIRNSLEKMKEMLSTEIAQLKKESSLESLINANSVLDESIEMIQRGVQVMEYRQALTGTDQILEGIKRNISKISQVSNNLRAIPATPPQTAPTQQPTLVEEPVEEEQNDVEEVHSVRPSSIQEEVRQVSKSQSGGSTAGMTLEEKQAEAMRKIKEKEDKSKKKTQKYRVEF